jgi:hypothetical protein
MLLYLHQGIASTGDIFDERSNLCYYCRPYTFALSKNKSDPQLDHPRDMSVNQRNLVLQTEVEGKSGYFVSSILLCFW